jgi:acetyl-CoA acetyltransferase
LPDGQSPDASIATAQVGHPDYEVPLGPTIPAYYGLVASRWIRLDRARSRRVRGADARACRNPSRGAVLRPDHTVADVMASKPVALPLKFLDCYPVSDGGAAFVISREPTGGGTRARARPRLRASARPTSMLTQHQL